MGIWLKIFGRLFRKNDKQGETANKPGEFDRIFVGEVLSIEKHPNADRLRLAKVRVGAEEIGPIVCGAANLEVGQKVAVAFEGANLIDSHDPEKRKMTLRKATIRGVESQAMICSDMELGLGENHDGIMVLDEHARSGEKFGEYISK